MTLIADRAILAFNCLLGVHLIPALTAAILSFTVFHADGNVILGNNDSVWRLQSNERKQKHLRLLGGSLFKWENLFNKYLYRVHAKTFTIINRSVVLVHECNMHFVRHTNAEYNGSYYMCALRTFFECRFTTTYKWLVSFILNFQEITAPAMNFKHSYQAQTKLMI